MKSSNQSNYMELDLLRVCLCAFLVHDSPLVVQPDSLKTSKEVTRASDHCWLPRQQKLFPFFLKVQ